MDSDEKLVEIAKREKLWSHDIPIVFTGLLISGIYNILTQ